MPYPASMTLVGDPDHTTAPVETHRVHNQPPPLEDFDPMDCDPALREALAAQGAADRVEALRPLARLAGSATAREHGRLANENPPKLRSHDRYGHRVDEVEFHPSWHWLMERAVSHGLHASPWSPEAPLGAHVERAAGFYLWSQAEAGHGCPVSMTFAAVPALRHSPELAAHYEPGLRSGEYDFGLRRAEEKSGLLAGMSMTEKQGGSDVRANSTTAEPLADGSYRIVGHKWFTSAPMNDLFLTLAHTPEGLSCLLVPRVLPDGSRNAVRLQRLKDKLGNRSNASAEIEYTGALGWLLGEPGRGVRAIIDMVSMTRMDCVLGSAAALRTALSEATHHAAHRRAFDERLDRTPLMRSVLSDLALESEAATALGMRLAAAVDRGHRGRAEETELLRLLLPAAKYYVCKRTPTAVGEALECLGGNGYVEESGMPRIYREAPLMSIWEGSGNVTALDTLRALHKQPETSRRLLEELSPVLGRDERYDEAVRLLREELSAPQPARARRLAELVTLTTQAALLLRGAPEEVSEAFLATRFGTPGLTPGSTGVGSRLLLDRVTPGARP